VKCFGCDIGPLSVVDLVMEVLDLKNPGDAARWVAARFEVPVISTGKHLVAPERHIFQYPGDSDLSPLIHSGLWARLSPPARALAMVLLEFAEPCQQHRSHSDQLMEQANANCKQMREEIDSQRQIRAEARAKRKKAVLTK
jgi:hypothetical protein